MKRRDLESKMMQPRQTRDKVQRDKGRAPSLGRRKLEKAEAKANSRLLVYVAIFTCAPAWFPDRDCRTGRRKCSPERPTGPKPTPPCSQRIRRRGRLRELYEPRARLPVRPGGLRRRRLDGTLSVSYQIQSPSGVGSENMPGPTYSPQQTKPNLISF